MTRRMPAQPDPSATRTQPGHQPAAGAAGREPDLVLAGLHLRLGALALARAELEGSAGAGRLDAPALADLAEVRWRTGDLVGAGEAATVALESGDARVSTYVIAAEAMAQLGRPGEARRLASHALEASGGSVGDTFAGMPRASIWPTDPAAGGTLVTTLAGDLAGSGTGTIQSPADAVDLLEPAAGLDAARDALAGGDPTTAALHLAIVLRGAPTLAPAVLELLDGVDGAAAALTRGDAYRLVGHERDARSSFATAATALRSDAPAPITPPANLDKETT